MWALVAAVVLTACDSGVASPEAEPVCRRSAETSLVPVSLDPGGYALTYIGERIRLEPSIESGGTVFELTWEVADPNVVTIDASGTLQAQGAGSSVIRVQATACNKVGSAEALVRVEQVPETIEFASEELSLDVGEYTVPEVVVLDAGGHPIANPDVSWESSDSAVVRVDATGTLAALSKGAAEVVAGTGDYEATTENTNCRRRRCASFKVRVGQDQVGSVVIDPSPLSLTVGTSATLETEIRDKSGEVVDVPVEWTTSDASIASVSQEGRVTARKTGLAFVEATADRVTTRVEVTVTAVPVASVEVLPGSVDLTAGEEAQLRATPRDADGNAMESAVQWRSSNASVVVVRSNGTVVAQGPGSATVTASSGSASGSAGITVTAAPVASVSVDPSSLNLTVGQSSAVTATLLDANGNQLDRAVSWSSANASVATVSSNGQVTGRAEGETTITATAEGKSATVRVAVSSVPVASVSVQPGSMDLTVGSTGQLQATPRDAGGNALDRTVEWRSSDAAVATVSSNGIVTARAAGSTTITASSGSASGRASITVSVVPVASVSVSPTSLSLTVGQSNTVRATLRDSNGNTLDRAVSWSSADAAVATVSSNGTVTARGAGSTTVRASSEGKSATVSVTVAAVPVASVSVQPGSLDLTVGGTRQLQATPRDASGNALDRSVSWSSGNTSVATVSSNGTVTARAAGTARITATSEGKTGTAQVTVTVEPVARVDVSPSSVGLDVGETRQLSATPRDASGNALNRSVSWSSSNTSVATVSSNGTVTARGAGSATIRATSESVTGSAQVSVTQPAQSGGTLTWRPPSGWESYTTRTLPASGGVVTLNDNTDYLLLNPTSNGGVITGTLTIKGGRNVVWIGGEVRIDTYKQESESVQSGVRVWSSDNTRVQGRIVHLEGLLIHGQHLADGLVINAPEAVVQAQNIHARPNRPASSGIHADVIQAWGGVRELRVDHLTGYTSYQGFMLKADYNGPSGPMDFRNVNLSDNGSNSSRYLVWWEPNKNTTIDLQNVWVRLSSSKVLGKAVWPDRDAGDSSVRPTVTSDGTSTYAEWRNTSQATGMVREGTPPGGDFADRNQVGLGYRSPGYN